MFHGSPSDLRPIFRNISGYLCNLGSGPINLVDLDRFERVLDKATFCGRVWTRQEPVTQLQGALKTPTSGNFETICGCRCAIWRGGRIADMSRLTTKHLKAV